MGLKYCPWRYTMPGRINPAECPATVQSLLENTASCVSKTGLRGRYTKQLHELEKELREKPGDRGAIRSVHDELVNIRKEVREQGYDLSAAADTLSFDGFRNDSSLAEGFKRMVMFMTSRKIEYITGDENHIELDQFLENRITGASSSPVRIIEKHHLWYRRDGRHLVLSGADSEMKDAFLHLEEMGKKDPLLFLSALKELE